MTVALDESRTTLGVGRAVIVLELGLEFLARRCTGRKG